MGAKTALLAFVDATQDLAVVGVVDRVEKQAVV
jgi:hypothetical protein